jgi:hypothetical protein
VEAIIAGRVTPLQKTQKRITGTGEGEAAATGEGEITATGEGEVRHAVI